MDNRGLDTGEGSTLLRSISSGAVTNITATILTDSSATWQPGALKGLKFAPDINQSKLFTVIDNDATNLWIDPVEGDLTQFTAIGSTYAGTYAFTKLTVIGKGRLSCPDRMVVATDVTVDGSTLVTNAITANKINVMNGGLLNHWGTTTTKLGRLDLNVAAAVTVDSTSKIDVSARGYLGGRQSGNNSNTGRTIGNTTVGGSNDWSGGSYGGVGGGGGANAVYGDVINPNELGSGGGSAGDPGGNGGGLVRLEAASLILDGSIVADGGAGGYPNGSGGSGGGIRIDVGTLSGAGTIAARGGAGTNYGGGGGGRIAIYYDSMTLPHSNLLVSGATRNRPGVAGTVYLHQNTFLLTITKSGTGTGTVISAPAGISCGSACSGEFAKYSNVTITATPDAGSLFSGWSGACNGTDTCTVTMDAAKSVTATFTAVPAPLVAISSPVGIIKNNRPVLQYSVSAGTVVVKVDGVVVNKVSGDTLDSLTDGPHTIRVEATYAGITSYAENAVTVDTIAPSVTVNTIPGVVTKPNVTLSGTIEAGSTIMLSANTAASIGTVTYPTSTTWECTVSDLAVDLNTVTVTATDQAGNASTAYVALTYQPSVTIVLSTGAIAADYQGTLGITVGRVSPAGAEVTIEQFVDANRNGAVDAGDYAIRSFKATDSLVSGNRNVPGDEDGTADAAIRTTIPYYLAGDLYHAPGHYLFRVTKGTENDAVAFTVDPVTQPQSIAGTVTDGTNPLPGAMVELVDKWQRHVAYALADETGNYLLQVKQPGDYYLSPSAYGYMAAKTPVSLAADQNLTDTTLTLTAGTYHVTGTVKDAGSGAGVAGIWIRANSADSTGVAMTDANGAYDLPLPAGQHTLTVLAGVNGPGAFATGNAGFNRQSVTVTVNGNVAVTDITLPAGDIPATGRVLDGAGNPLVGFPVEGKVRGAVDSREPVSFGITDAAGTYTLGLFAGTNWDISLNSATAQILGYLGAVRRDLSTATGPLTGNDLVAQPITAWVQGIVKDSANNLLTGVEVRIRNADSSIAASVVTASDGTYLLGASAGNWFVTALTEAAGTHPVTEQEATLTDGQTANLDFVVDVTPPALTINPVATPTNVPLQTITGTMEEGAAVTVALDTTAVVGPVSYPTSTTWSCTLTGLAEGVNTITVTSTDAATNTTTATTVISLDTAPPTVAITSPAAGTTTSQTPLLAFTISDGTVVVKVDDLVVNKVSGDTLDILASGQHTLRIESTDAAGNVGSAQLTFTVNRPPVFNPTSITKPNGTAGVAYTGQTIAGAAIDPEGDAITYAKISGPAWLSVAANGALSGTPSTAANDSFIVRATATGGAADAFLNITVVANQPPVFSPATITKPNATAGASYTGQTIAGAATDPEGDAITYTKVSGPAWLTVAANGTLSGIPTVAANDSFVVRATSTGGTADAILNITVGEALPSVAQLNAWTNLYSAAPNNTSATNLAAGSFTVGSGSNRLLLVAVVMEIGTAANPTISAKYGGTALTQIKVTANTQREIVWVGYLKESQIGSGSKALTVTYSGATGKVSALHVKWAAFTGVNQANPIVSSGATNTSTTSATFGSTINYVLNGMTTVVAGNGGTPATGTLSAIPAFSAGTATTTNAQTSNTFTTAMHTANGSYASSTAVTWSGTTSLWSGLVVMSLQPALPNQPPAFNPTTITKPNAYVGIAYSGQTLAGAATDPDGDPITYTKVSGPSWLSVATDGTLSGTPTVTANDTFVVRATATGGSADATMNISVVVNQPSAFSPATITKPNATVGVAYTGQTLAGTATDPEGDTITYTKVSGPAWLSVAANGALSGTPTVTANDSFVIRATSTGGTADATLNITVVATPPAVAQLNAWTNLYSAAPNNTSATNLAAGSFTVGSGSNRLLLVAVVMEIGTAANPTISTSYGGTALTQIKVTANTQREIVWVGYLKESQIGSGAKALTVTYSGATGNVSALHVKWAAFTGVNQTTPIASSGGTNTASTSATFGSTINYVTNGMTTVVAGNGGTPATGSLSATPAFTAGTATTTNAQTSRTFVTAKHTANGSYATEL